MYTLSPTEELNKKYLDLYGDCLKPFITLPDNASFEDIIKQVDTNKTIGYKHQIVIGKKLIVATRKYTWLGNFAKTNYVHIYHVTNFDESKMKVLTHWKQQKDGKFKTV